MYNYHSYCNGYFSCNQDKVLLHKNDFGLLSQTTAVMLQQGYNYPTLYWHRMNKKTYNPVSRLTGNHTILWHVQSFVPCSFQIIFPLNRWSMAVYKGSLKYIASRHLKTTEYEPVKSVAMCFFRSRYCRCSMRFIGSVCWNNISQTSMVLSIPLSLPDVYVT